MKILILLFLILSSFSKALAQDYLDTNVLVFNAKIKLLEFVSGGEVFNEDYFFSYLKTFNPELNLDINNGGFEYSNLVFFSLNTKHITAPTGKTTDSGNIRHSFFLLFEKKVYFAFERKTQELFILDQNYLRDFYLLNQIKPTLCDKESKIEGLDLKCMCKAIRKIKLPYRKQNTHGKSLPVNYTW
ncbi:MAG: hypothetical protein N4A45_04650 [Flavobacteriales bacterium]|jgi:hypothetical protein|nr:hypothetical protein [Flavobacteriales bacterium]